MADLLGTQLAAEDFTLQTGGGGQPSRRRFVGPPKTDLEKMRQVLEAAANDDVFPNSSLNQLGDQTEVQPDDPAAALSGALTEEIKERHQKYCEIRIEVRAKLFRSIVNSTVMSLHKAGIYPSQCRVRESLPKCVDMREPVAQQEWKETLAKLNYMAV